MSFKNYIDGLIEVKANEAIGKIVTLIQQTSVSNSQTVTGTVTEIGADGSITVNTNTGLRLTGLKTTTDNGIGVGTTGIVLAGSVFIS